MVGALLLSRAVLSDDFAAEIPETAYEALSKRCMSIFQPSARTGHSHLIVLVH